ncbi:MAG: hypothetical protein JWR50_54 [Mucilaginibacter sp.]|nr:hypothetical protein [Mucilaginibacter sp.]
MKLSIKTLNSKSLFWGMIFASAFFYVALLFVKVNHISVPFRQELFICAAVTSAIAFILIIYRAFYSFSKLYSNNNN